MHGYWILDNNTFVMNVYFVCFFFLAVVQCKWHSHMYFIYRAYHQTSVKKEVFSCRTRSSYDKLWCWVCESITNYRTGCFNDNHLKLIKLIIMYIFIYGSYFVMQNFNLKTFFVSNITIKNEKELRFWHVCAWGRMLQALPYLDFYANVLIE